MTKQRFTPADPAELRERGVRLFRENRAGYSSDTAAYKAIAPKPGFSPDSPCLWCQQAEGDAGQCGGLTSDEKDRIKEAFDGSRGRHGARKVWHQLRRKGHDIARSTVERLAR